MTYLLDTNTCIKYLNGRSEKIKQHLDTLQAEDILMCSVVKAELFYGAIKSARPTENLSKQHYFVNRFSSLPFDDRAAEIYAEIRARLEKLGTPIGPNDLLIAAIALANQVTLVTHNTGEFGRVEGLQWEDWEL